MSRGRLCPWVAFSVGPGAVHQLWRQAVGKEAEQLAAVIKHKRAQAEEGPKVLRSSGVCQKLLLRRSRLMRFGEVQVVVMVAQAAQTMTASPRLVNSGAGFAACLAAMDGPVVELNRNLRRQLGCILIWGSTLDAMPKFVVSSV